jgi:hypothetical protein
VTLTRLVLAWLAVAVWFVVANVGTALLVGPLSLPHGEVAWSVRLPLRVLKWRLVEALLLTLLGSLWFASLGSGEWWLVFLVVGAIAAIPAWVAVQPTEPRPVRASVVGASADLARYVLAGAILAWRLG